MSISHGTYNGYSNYKCRCDDCRQANADYMREYKRKRKLRDPEFRARNVETNQETRVRARARNKRIRQEFLDAGCLDCGSAEDLHFHHVDPSTKVKEVASLAGAGASVEALLAEIEKCVVVCQPCHMARHDRMRQGLPQEPTSALEA